MNKFKYEMLFITGCLVNFYIIPCVLFSVLYNRFQFYLADGVIWMMLLGWLVQLTFAALYGRSLEKDAPGRGMIFAAVSAAICFFPQIFGTVSPLTNIEPGRSAVLLAVLAAAVLSAVGAALGCKWKHLPQRPKKEKRKAQEDDVFD